MSLHEEITSALHAEIDAKVGAIILSPTTLALAVQDRYGTGHEPHVAYTSLEHLKHMARAILGGRFDTDGLGASPNQADLFTGHLQDRYPVPRVRGEEPKYKQRDALSSEEVAWNVEQLRKSADARLRHADALAAWADGRAAKTAA